MNLFYFMILYSVVTSIIFHDTNAFSSIKFVPAVTFKVVSGGQLYSRPNLKLTNQKLANNFLPVWIVNDNTPTHLHKLDYAMRLIGPFAMYQDPLTSSAAVYFHDESRFDGTIDSRFIINNFQINSEHDGIFEVDKHSGIYRRQSSRYYSNIEQETKALPQTKSAEHPFDYSGSSYVSYAFNGYKLSRNNERHVCKKKVVYIETLVIVHYDLTEQLQSEPFDYTSIVRYVLILFNSVDMLYSKLNTTEIKISIAGIVVATSRESLPYINKNCYGKNNNEEINADCANDFISSIRGKGWTDIPRESYDVAIFLTGHNLFKYYDNQGSINKKLKQLGGLARSPSMDYYKLMKEGSMRPLVAIISDRGEYESFPIIVHELAHLLTVEHDELSSKHQIMYPYGKYNRGSLSWSEASRSRLMSFFTSPDSCMFINKPRALYPPGPRRMLTCDQQCRCYGYKYAKKTVYNSIMNICTHDCTENIRCKNNKGEIHEGPIFMDGTPCGKNKVCWNQECVDII